MKTLYQLTDLLYLMERLRNPDTGCPWDVKQDFQSLVKYTLEEAYEVADAIHHQDWPHVEEELGDLLLQVVFYGQLGREHKRFDFSSIVQRLVEKLIRRHPHVFPDGTLHSERSKESITDADEARGRWDAVKQQERLARVETSLLAGIPAGMPALLRAEKMQKKASQVGFDWPDAASVFPKVEEELQELKEEMDHQNTQRCEEELGDLLFAITNLARHLNIDPETALRGSNHRFQQRFDYVEQVVSQEGGWQETSAERMEEVWEEAKRALRP